MLDEFAEPFKSKVLKLMLLMSKEHLPMKFFEGRRSFKRSAELFSLGRECDSAGLWRIVDKTKIVSNAKAGQSPHNWGLAADFVLDGPKPWDTSEESMKVWERYGQLADDVGLEWGGKWKFKDLPHVELKSWQQVRPSNWVALVTEQMKKEV